MLLLIAHWKKKLIIMLKYTAKQSLVVRLMYYIRSFVSIFVCCSMRSMFFVNAHFWPETNFLREKFAFSTSWCHIMQKFFRYPRNKSTHKKSELQRPNIISYIKQQFIIRLQFFFKENRTFFYFILFQSKA